MAHLGEIRLSQLGHEQGEHDPGLGTAYRATGDDGNGENGLCRGYPELHSLGRIEG